MADTYSPTITAAKGVRAFITGAVSVGLGAALLAFTDPGALTAFLTTADVSPAVIAVAVPVFASGVEMVRNWWSHRGTIEAVDRPTIYGALQALEERLMDDTKKRYEDLISRLDQVTNAIALKLDVLAQQIRAGGLTADQETRFADQLAAMADRLEALGADPAAPVPTLDNG